MVLFPGLRCPLVFTLDFRFHFSFPVWFPLGPTPGIAICHVGTFAWSHLPFVDVVQCLCFMFSAFAVGFSWPCWCSLTGSPGVALVPLPHPISLRMSFSILHLPPGPLLPVVLIFHYSSCHVDQLVFSQDASSRLPFASVLSWPSVGPDGCGCPTFELGHGACQPAPLPLTWLVFCFPGLRPSPGLW